MALSDLLNVLVKNYARRPTPTIKQDELGPYVQDQLREIEASIKTLADAAVTVSDQEPTSKRKGMIRFAVSPWDPLGDGSEGIVVYEGGVWEALGPAAASSTLNATTVDLGDWTLTQSGSDLKFAYAGTNRFSLSSTGALTDLTSITGPTTNATTVDLGAWTLTQSGNDLKFAYNGVNKFKLASNGHLTVVENVTAFGSA